MPKRRIRGAARRRLGPYARDRVRAARAADELATVHQLNLPPAFGDTIVLAQEWNCASCPTEIQAGDEATWIDGELNCPECTEEARRG